MGARSGHAFVIGARPRMQLRVRRFAKRGPVGLVRAEPGPGRPEDEKLGTAA